MKYCFFNYIKLPQTLYPNSKSKLEILGFNLEIGLRVVTNRTYIGSFFANDDVTAVAALPNHLLVAGENKAAFYIG